MVNASVVAYEYPGSDDKHYPYPTVDKFYEKENEKLKDKISKNFNNRVSFQEDYQTIPTSIKIKLLSRLLIHLKI